MRCSKIFRSDECGVVFVQQAPAAAADGSTPWEVADGLLYPEDILDESPYLFVEIPGRLTGSYSGYNVDPLFVVVRPSKGQLLCGKISRGCCMGSCVISRRPCGTHG